MPNSPSSDRCSGLYVQTLGQGPDVVFLHGWGMHSGMWEPVAEALLDNYRITLLDLPGHGYSPLTDSDHTLFDLSHAVAAATPPKAAWVGWSLGGLIAQRLAIDAPERVAKLVLVSSSACFVLHHDWPHGVDYRILHAFADNLNRDYRATLKRFIALEVHGSEDEAAQRRRLREIVFQHGEPNSRALRDGLAILQEVDLRGKLNRIACPVLLLSGRRDTIVPVSAAAAMQRLLPDARLHIFEWAAHAPFFSHPAEFVSHLRAFLDE